MPLFGKDAVLYYSSSLKTSSSDADSMSWTEEANVIDLTDTFTPTDVDITTRETAQLGWEATATVLKAGEKRRKERVDEGVTMLGLHVPTNLASTPIALMDLSGDKDTDDGAFGLAANFSIAISMAKPVKGVQTMDVTAKIYNYPEWVTVEAS